MILPLMTLIDIMMNLVPFSYENYNYKSKIMLDKNKINSDYQPTPGIGMALSGKKSLIEHFRTIAIIFKCLTLYFDLPDSTIPINEADRPIR